VSRLPAALVLAAVAQFAGAHEVRPAFLELRETEPGTYSFFWKKPSGGEVEIFIANYRMPDSPRMAAAG